MFKKAVFLFFFLHVCVCMQAKDYFVKMNGDGSGSSWEDALSPLDFAEKIDAGEQDATFHLAEGTYYPMLEFKRTIVFENMYSRAYQVKANTKIIGGYPPSPEKGDVSNPDRFKTTFSVDYQGNDIVKFAKSSFGNGMDSIVVTNDGDNDEYIFEVVKPNLNFTMYGVQLKHAKHGAICAQEECAIDLKKCFFMDNGGAGVLAENPSIKLNMDSCRSYRTAFKVGLSTVYAPESREVTLTNSVIQNSGMYKNNAGGGVYFAGGVVKNCLFYKCCSNAAAAIFSVGVSDENSYVSNCTFIGNRCYSQATVWFLGQSRDTLVNCTMVGNLATDIPERSNFVKDEQFCLVQGNYIVGEPMFSMVDDPDENVMIKNNVLTHKATGFFGELDLDDSNILLDEKTALEGLGMSSSFDFTVVDTSLNYVPLLVDVLADKSIRFPRVVGTDARGVERCELTCPGAYEIRNCDEPQCLPDTTIASPSDTIYAGQMFLGKTYAYACRIDSIFETLQNINGCDSVVMHTLIVKPDPTRTEYYVKTNGNGDGSSWEKAMSPQSFASTLPQAGDDVTFYVAEGVYKPIYNYLGETPFPPNQATYFVQSNVTINGGYSKDAKTGAVADPDNYKTIFSGDIFGNDEAELNKSIENDLSISNSIVSDDAYTIFTLAQSRLDIYYDDAGLIISDNMTLQDNGKRKYFNINGVYLDGGRLGIRSINPSIHISIENTSFTNFCNEPFYLTQGPTSVKVTNSALGKCTGGFQILQADTIVFTNIKISQCNAYSAARSNKNQFVHLSGLEVKDNISYYIEMSNSLGSKSHISMEDCKIENNIGSSGGTIYVLSGKLVAKNCLFKGNRCCPLYVFGEEAHLENCDFIENKIQDVYDGYCMFLGGHFSREDANEETSLLTSATLKNCTFKSNECRFLCELPVGVRSTKDSIIGCAFEDNTIEDFMFQTSDNLLFIGNSTIRNNIIGSRGIVEKSNNLHIINTQFEGNKTKGIEEPAKYSIRANNLYVNNSTFKNNECDSIFFWADTTAEFTNSTIENNSAKKLVYGFSQKLDVENCLFKENVSNLFYHKNVEQDNAIQLSFKNTDFISNQTLDNEVAMELSMNTGDKIDFSRVNFIGNSAKYILNDKNGNTNISKCDFFNNNVVGLLTLSNMTSTVEASSFRQNKMSNGHLIYSPDVNLTLKNNTIVSNEANGGLFSVYPSAAQVYLYNNTIISNGDYASSLVGGSLLDHAMIGNVIGEKLSNRFKENNISNNLFLKTEDVSIPDDILSNNIFTDDFSILFDGTYDSSTGLFTPELEMNEDFTPVVALKTDKLSDGTSLRFPLSETTVTTDQRGVKRLNSTSMGAYEAGCPSDTTLVNDTIYEGQKFLGKIYTEVGLHNNIIENLQNINGCDSVVAHTLMVKPDSNAKSYIVTNTNDGGEGSLRYAIEYATLSEVDTFHILFDFAQSGTHVIQIGSALSLWKRDNLIIDGSSTPDSIIIDGGNGKFDGLYVWCLKNLSINSLSIKNAKNGISVQGSDIVNITNCRMVENSTGIYIASKGVTVDNCLMSGNTEYGIERSSATIVGCHSSNRGTIIKNCIIGLTDDQEKIYPNNVGIYLNNNSGLDTIIGNIVSGNTTNGFVIQNANNNGVTLLRNLIGVNDKYQDFGNGGSGISYIGRSQTNNGQIANANKSDANIIGYNHDYGITSTGLVNCGVNYIGVTPDGTIIGNKKGGINANGLTADGVVISGNEGDGIHLFYNNSSSSLYLKNSIIGGETPQKEGNKGYGISVENVDLASVTELPLIIFELENNTFGNNVKGGIYGDIKQILLSGGGSRSYLTQNIFWGESQPFAIDLGDFNKPTIEDIIDKGDEYELVGSVQFLDGSEMPQSNKVDSTKVGIELFWNKGSKETAYAYVGSTESDATGKWKYNLKKTDLEVTDISFISTAIHYINYTYGINYTTFELYTSALSDPYDCEICTCATDTISTFDTINVGEKFLDKVYTTVGRHDSIFETAQNQNGCDSVVMHTLIVKPDPTKKEYYVKTKRWGKGDGSSWENAMDSIDFATYFPLIEDGTTFYIAEGTYKPIYNSEMKLAEIGTDVAFYVNASFSIRGGYPADAKTGAVSDPKNHPTIFDGDILGNDEIEESMDNDGFMTVKKTKTEDNAIFLFNRGKRETYDYTYDFDGVNFKNTRYVIYCRSWHNYVKISNSEISYNEGPLFFIPYENDALEISNSIFRKNLGQIISTSASSNLKMDSVLFEYNQAGLIRKTATSSGQPTHNVTLNRIYAYSNAAFDIYSMGHNFSMRNSEIKNNIGSLTLYDNSLLESNVFENNKGIISKSGYAGLTIDKCTFIGNSAMTYLSAQKGSNETNYLSIRNSSFINTTADNYLIYASLDSINVDSTVFIDNSGAKISFSSYQFANLSHSKYSDNKNAHLDFSGKSDGETHVNGNSFVGNNSETLFDFSSGPLVTEISNNTIVSNNCEGSFVIYFHGCSPYLYNNTIVGNNSDHPISQVAGSNNEFYGNIILGNGVGEKIQLDYSSGIAFKNNIMPGINGTGCSQEGVANAPENNIVSIFNSEITLCDVFKDIPNRNEEILTALFEGTYDKEKNLFTPVIQDNGGPTPTVALKSDRLPDGTSIRFPLTETVVATDQRGVERLDSTCMGAYELTCDLIVTQIKDTIQMGNSYTFGGVERSSSITTPGDYYFENTLTSVMGCDSIVKLDLHVYVIDTTQTTGTICLGSDYTLDGWNIQTTGYEPGSYTFYRSLDKENTEELILNIVKTNSVSIEDLEVVSPFCPGGSYGRIEFAADWEDMTESPYITVYNGEGRTLYNEPLNNYVRFSGLPADNYQVRIAVSESNSCFKDTVFNLVMKDVDSMSAIGPDTLYTSCVEKPNASATIELFNYHPSFDLRLDGKLIKRYGRTPNCRLLDGERMGDNYKAMLQLDSMAVGKHTIRVVDYCGNGYDVFTFVVVGPDPATFEVLSLDGNLKCSGDYGSVSLRRKGSEGSMIELSSDLFKETYSFDEGVMDMKIENLPGGEYTLHITNGDKSCPDGQTETIIVKRPEPLNVDLMVNGIVCQDAVITAYATGENENYTYTWVKPDGQEVTTSTNTLANVGAGKYKCVVKDSEGCSTAEGEAFVSEIENLSELKLISVTQDETCFGTDNAEVVVIYYDNNEHQAVTCQLTNKNTGEVVESVTSMLYWGGFHLQKIQPGDYHISLRYGTEDCNLDLNEVTKDITIKAKAKPLVIGTPVVKNVTCLSQPNGQIDFDVTGWEKGYTAELASRSVQPVSVSADSTAHFTFKGVSEGEYLFRVNDDCKVKDEAISIKVGAIEPYELELDPVKTSLQCARSNDGEVVLNVSGGDHGNAVLSCNSFFSQTIEQDGSIRLTNLTKGNYTVVYRSSDNTCADKETLDFTIEAPERLEAKFSVSGLGCDDMKLTATVSGEEKPYKFHWKKNGKMNLITRRNYFPFALNMGDSIYCMIWSENGCDTIEQVIRIPKEEEMPDLTIASKAKQERCYKSNDAEISVTTSISSRLLYSVPVTIGLKQSGDNDFQTVNVVTDKTASHVFTDLAAGTYIVKAHFGTEGCSAGFVTVYDTVEVEPLHEMSTLAMEKHDRTCLNENNGYIAFTVDGWSDSHRTWTTNELSILGQTITFPMKRIMPYKVEGQVAYFRIDNPEENKDIKLWINDACGNNFITQPQRVNKKVSEYVVAPLLTNNKLDCNYSETGWAILAVKGGYYGGNTFYREGDEANAVSLSAGKAISVTGLGAGIHTFHYKSTEENCTDESTYQLLVAPRNPLSFNTSLAGEECKDRKIVAEVTGGNTPVEVAWYSEKSLIKKDQGDTHELQGVGAGVFHYTITDAKGCEYKSDAIPANLYDPETDNLAISGVKADSTSCSNIEDGVVNVTYTGNDYQSDLFVILQGSAKTDTIRADKEEGTVALQNLASGQYNISLRYAAAGVCPTNSNAEQSVRLFSPDKLDVSVKNHDVVCDVVHGGAVSAYIQGGTPEYTVAWYLLDETSATPLENHKSELKDTLRGLSVKNSYFCKITDRNGCVSTSDTVTIGTQPMPDLNAITVDKIAVEDESCYHGNNGSVFVAYTNYTTNLPLKLLLYDEEGNPLTGVSDNHIDGIIETKDIAPGNYMLYLDVDFTDEGCENSLSPRLLENIHVESVKEPLSLKDISVVKPTCLTKPNGKASFVVSGWHDKDTVTLTIAGEREIYEPSEVDGETALFNIDNLKGGDLTITVSDVCGNSVSQQPTYGGITELGLEVGLTYTNLKCSYSTNGFAEIKVNGGVKDSLYLCMFSVKNGESTARDTVMNPSGTVRFENLEPNDFRFHLYTSVKNCPDVSTVGVVVKAPEPIVFDKAIEGVVCENTRSGEINFVPHRRGEAVKYDNKEVSNNLIDEIYFGEYDTYFPHVTSLSITGKGLSALEMDTVMIESISYGSFQNSGGFDYDEDDEVEEEASCEREVNGLCVAPKKDPLTSLWREKGGVYQYPRYWVGMQSLPGTTYYVKATDDSACVFIDSFNILPPDYKTLSIDNVFYDANAAICDAEKRRVELKVSGGWGDYQYIFLPDHETEGSSGLADSQTYIAGDSTWYENGKGFYRSYILDPDKYTIIVMDKKGCKKEYSQKIEVRSNIMVGGRSMIDPCGSDSTNMIKVKATRSSWYADYSPYEYQLRYEDTSLGERYLAPTKTDSVILYDVPIGKIGVFAYDKNGCSGYTNIVVKSSESLFEFNVSTFDQSAAKCYNEPSGLLRFYVMGANPPYRSLTLDGETLKDYELMHVDWAKNDTLFRLPDEKGFRMFDSISIKGLLGGEHVLTIIDSLGCRKEHKFTIEQPDELTLSISASSVCPDGEEGRIVAERTTGGTSPYEYSFDQETGFTDKQFLESKLGVERSMYVKDANGCVAKSSNTAAVDASISWGDVSPDVLVSSWQNFDDVLAFIDMTTYDNPGGKIKYDSATVKPYGIEVLNNGKASDSIFFEVVDPAIYTYGIPDSVEYILLWNNDTIWGPSWGVPTDIAAGVRSPEVYKKLKQDIDARKKKLNEGLENLIKNFKKKENPTLAETEKFLDDSTSFALRLDSIRSEERQNCTIEMIKGHFKRLMDESVIKRMTFVRLQSSIYDLESLNDGDSLLFRYNFTHTVYLSNCDMSTDYNFSSESLYGIRVSENGFNPYKVYAKRDIIEFEVSPNPASPNEECSIYLVLSRKTTPAIMVHNMVGKELQNSLNISEPEEVKEDGEIVYRYNITGLRLAFSAVITVRTDRDAASKVVIVN